MSRQLQKGGKQLMIISSASPNVILRIKLV